MRILLDPGHGADTAGKRSPDGRLREYAYAREIAEAVERGLLAKGYDAERIVTEEEDISLRERCRRANAICDEVGKENVLLVSIHCNAAGDGSGWMSARGWSAYVSQNASVASKALARRLIEAAEGLGLKVRKYSHQVPYWTQSLAICRDTKCAAVLTENLFQDNREDVEYLLSEEGKQAITALHVQGIMSHIESAEGHGEDAGGAPGAAGVLDAGAAGLVRLGAQGGSGDGAAGQHEGGGEDGDGLRHRHRVRGDTVADAASDARINADGTLYPTQPKNDAFVTLEV